MPVVGCHGGDEQAQGEQGRHAEQERRSEPDQVLRKRDLEDDVPDDDKDDQADRPQRPC